MTLATVTDGMPEPELPCPDFAMADPELVPNDPRLQPDEFSRLHWEMTRHLGQICLSVGNRSALGLGVASTLSIFPQEKAATTLQTLREYGVGEVAACGTRLLAGPVAYATARSWAFNPLYWASNLDNPKLLAAVLTHEANHLLHGDPVSFQMWLARMEKTGVPMYYPPDLHAKHPGLPDRSFNARHLRAWFSSVAQQVLDLFCNSQTGYSPSDARMLDTSKLTDMQRYNASNLHHKICCALHVSGRTPTPQQSELLGIFKHLYADGDISRLSRDGLMLSCMDNIPLICRNVEEGSGGAAPGEAGSEGGKDASPLQDVAQSADTSEGGIEEERQKNAQLTRAASNLAGDSPMFEGYRARLKKAAKRDYKQVLRPALRRSCTGPCGRRTLAKPYVPTLAYNLILPTRAKAPQADVMIMVDTSGSMDWGTDGDSPADRAVAEMLALTRTLPITSVLIIPCDAVVHTPILLTPSNSAEASRQLGEVLLEGGGGTSFVPPFEWLASPPPEFAAYLAGTRFAGCVFYTDGYGTCPSPSLVQQVAPMFGGAQNLFWCTPSDANNARKSVREAKGALGQALAMGKANG